MSKVYLLWQLGLIANVNKMTMAKVKLKCQKIVQTGFACYVDRLISGTEDKVSSRGWGWGVSLPQCHPPVPVWGSMIGQPWGICPVVLKNSSDQLGNWDKIFCWFCELSHKKLVHFFQTYLLHIFDGNHTLRKKENFSYKMPEGLWSKALREDLKKNFFFIANVMLHLFDFDFFLNFFSSNSYLWLVALTDICR